MAARPEFEEVVTMEVAAEEEEENRWARLLPELVAEVVRRVEASGGERCPGRKDVVSCTCVCRRWRDAMAAVVRPLPESGEDHVRGLAEADLIATNDKGKFLMAAGRFRRGAHTEYIITLDAVDLSQGSSAYLGKLRSDLWGTNFKVYDSQPPYDGAKASSTQSIRCF